MARHVFQKHQQVSEKVGHKMMSGDGMVPSKKDGHMKAASMDALQKGELANAKPVAPAGTAIAPAQTYAGDFPYGGS